MSGYPADHPKTVLVAHPSAELYGSDRMLLESVQGLTERGFAVIVSLPAAGPRVGELRSRGVAVELCRTPVLRKSALRPVGSLRLLVDSLVGFVAGLRLLRRVRPELIVVNTLVVPMWLLLARVVRRPAVCHVHEGEGSARPLMRRLLAAPLLLADQIVVNSRFVLSVLTEAFSVLGPRSTIILNGIAGPERRTSPRSQLISPVRLLYVGRISPRKGPAVAIEAARMLIASGLDVRLDLFGSVFPGYEWFQAELDAQVAAARELTGQIAFHGFIPNIWPHLAEADIVLVPSQFDEPFGNTAVEAVLAARPAVVTATSGLLEATDGYEAIARVEPGDAAALAAGIRMIIAQWKHFSEAATVDTDLARTRHAPSRYRSEIACLIESAGAVRT